MRRISGHYIFTNTGKILKKGIIHVSEIGEIIDIIDTNGDLKETQSVEFYNGVLCPGFVNCHSHIELSHLKKKITDPAGISGFISEIVKLRSAYTNDQILLACKDADLSMKIAGIVAVGDISNSLSSLAIKLQSKLYYHTFIEFMGLNPANAENILNKAEDLKLEFKTNGLQSSLGPHAPYSLSDELFELFGKSLVDSKEMISMHNQESNEENEIFEGKTNNLKEFLNSIIPDGRLPGNCKSGNLFYTNGMTSLKSIFPYIKSAERILLVHNTFIKRADFEEIHSFLGNIYFVLCPNSNLFIENALPPVTLIRKFSENICLGSDSLASNKKLCILEEMKTVSNNFPEIPLEELIKWGTLNGAKALGIENKFGSFETGKFPGIILIEDVDLHNLKLKENSRVRML